MKLSTVLGLGMAIALSACSAFAEYRIRQQLNDANRCTTAADCELIGSVCPFGCYIYVHTDEAERIRGVLDGYRNSCAYSCVPSQGVSCAQNRCEPMLETASQASEGA